MWFVLRYWAIWAASATYQVRLHTAATTVLASPVTVLSVLVFTCHNVLWSLYQFCKECLGNFPCPSPVTSCLRIFNMYGHKYRYMSSWPYTFVPTFHCAHELLCPCVIVSTCHWTEHWKSYLKAGHCVHMSLCPHRCSQHWKCTDKNAHGLVHSCTNPNPPTLT